MDMKKLCKLLFENEGIKNIPLEHVIQVAAVIIEIINSGECFYKEPPADMMAVYEYLHNQQIEKALEVKTLQTMYKDS